MGPTNVTGQPLYLTRSPLPAVDWDTFFDAVAEAMKLHIASTGPPGQRAPTLVAEYPKDNEGNPTTPFDLIIYGIQKSVRAATDPKQQRIPKGPTLRERRPHPTKKGYSLITIAWWEMMTVRFVCYGLSSTRADEITKWFHKMMMRYIFDLSFFRVRGVQYMTFEERGPCEFSREYGQEVHFRHLDYNVRLELIETFECKNLESINVTVGGPPNPEQSIDLVEQYKIPSP